MQHAWRCVAVRAATVWVACGSAVSVSMANEGSQPVRPAPPNSTDCPDVASNTERSSPATVRSFFCSCHPR